MEPHDFLPVYESKTDEELLLVARDIHQLTVEARAALESELSRRGLASVRVPEPHKPPEQSPRLPRPVIETTEFLGRVTRLYRDHFWLFIILIAPATVLGYVVQIVRRDISQSLLRSYLQGAITSQDFLLQVTVIGQAAYIISWLVFCIAFALICSGVARIFEGLFPTPFECFQELVHRKWKFSRTAMLLYVIFVGGLTITGLMITAFWALLPSVMRGVQGQAIVYGLGAIVALLASRLALAIPAVILDDKSVRQAIFLSDELTAGKWTILVALLCKSVVGGYIAGMLPFWVASWTDAEVSPWLLRITSAAAASIVEPLMFIGFSLLYVKATAEPAVESVSASSAH